MEFKQNTLINQIEDEVKEKEEQRILHEKHGIEDENVVVVEKPSLMKFILKSIGFIIRLLITIVFIGFAAVGIIGMVYTEPRELILEIIINGFSNL